MQITPTETSSLRMAACFALDDPAERLMFDAIRSYHAEPEGLCTLAAICRSQRDGQCVFLTATCFCPRRRGAEPEWSLIEWNAAQCSVRFYRQPSRAAAIRAVHQESLTPQPPWRTVPPWA